MTRRRRRRLKVVAVLAAVLVVALGVGAWWFQRDVPLPFPDWWLDLDLSGDGPLLAGAARVPITPRIVEGEGEEVWLAGYHTGRSATGVHDDLWARALVLRAGTATVAMVALDLIGLFQDEVIRIRKSLDPSLQIDYVVVASTHTHSGPDTMGLWGSSRLRTGVREEYQARVRESVVQAITTAAADLRPAALVFARRALDPEGLLRDSRRPVVMDTELSVCAILPPEGGEAIASIVNWSCHPEVMDSTNTLISSDFPHYLREAMEVGVPREGRVGLGGICLFLPGSIGGLQTPLEVPVVDREGRPLPEASFDKARAVGERLAEEALDALEGEGTVVVSRGPLRVSARTALVPIQNIAFQVATKLGVIRRGSMRGRKVRTEVGVIRVGPVPFLLLPGEIYPEIVVGGIESPPGQDHAVPPQEVPPLKEALGGEVRFLVGLANDEIGYLIPKSEWDSSAPYLYGAEESPYGEINSPGPDAARIIHREALYHIRRLQ